MRIKAKRQEDTFKKENDKENSNDVSCSEHDAFCRFFVS